MAATSTTEKIAPGAYSALSEALAVIYWNKRPFESFLRTALGEMSQEVLGSARVVSKRLQAAGFTFEDPTFADACRTALGEESTEHS